MGSLFDHFKTIKQKAMTTNGLIAKTSTQSFVDTYNTLKKVIDENPNLKLLLELDHSANAEKVGLVLPKTRILMFGNPKLGTVLMKENQTTGIDLPQKMLVVEEGQTVKVIYNDPYYLRERHQLGEAASTVLEKVSAALDTISNVAIGG